MKAMILAAGRGNRLRPLTDDTPKPLIKIGGRTLLEYRLDALAQAGINDVIINVAYKAHDIIAAIGDGSRYHLSIQYSFEPNGALETGGGILQALPLLGSQPFLVMNADIFTDYPLIQLPREPKKSMHLVLVNNPTDHLQGDFGLDGEYVVADSEKKYTVAGIFVYRPEFFDGLKPGHFSIVPHWRHAIAKQKITGEYYAGSWQDVGTMEQYQALCSSY